MRPFVPLCLCVSVFFRTRSEYAYFFPRFSGSSGLDPPRKSLLPSLNVMFEPFARYSYQQRRYLSGSKLRYPDHRARTVSRNFPNKYFRSGESYAGFSAVSEEVERGTNHQCIEWVRRNRGSLPQRPQLLFVEADIEWCDRHARSSASFGGHRSLCDVPRMGSDRHGRG